MVFVIASYASLVLLFYFLHLFKTAPPGSPAARGRAKIGVWLTAMFLWRVSVLVPWPVVGAGVCFMGASTVAGGFYALFLIPSSTENY
ncbi:unnamed protein product [Miscanthus lutarioriparius]|uniref:Uncharacterized protein n=1 Tax=Miscanthus lutarioriparius TaxID=422564 RepID=A0A811SI91_9POAL|nr:unnamed protein product [Miscanthus lutarioriparius]